MINTKKRQLVAIITGGARGIGAALAQEFLRHDVKVIVTSRNYSFNEIDTLSDKITDQKLDLTDPESVANFFSWFGCLKQPIDFLVNNAGAGIFKPLNELDIAEWKLILDTNLTGSFLCTKYAYPFLKRAEGARIINMGSISELCGLENNGVYAASKLGLRGISRVINEEWVSENIFCTHVVLGAVASEMWSGRKGFSRDDMLDVNQVARIIIDSVINSPNIRLDTIEILPKKGIL